MKNVFLGLVGIILLAVIVLWFKGREAYEVKTEVEITASPEKVWSVLTNINEWQNWSPIISKSSGEAQLGSKVDITMAGMKEGQEGAQYSPVITEFEEAKVFRWQAYMMSGFMFTNDKVFELEATATGTKLTHIEVFKGLMAPLMRGQVEKAVPGMLDSMNQALKELAEQ